MNHHARPVVGLVMPLASQQGGAERLLLHLLHAGSRSFRYVCAFLQDGPMLDEVRGLGYETTLVATTHLKDLRNYEHSVRELHAWIVRTEMQLVFSWMSKAHLYAAPATLGTGTRLAWFQHGLSRGLPMDMLAAALPADAVLCCSVFAKGAQDRRLPRRRSFACHPGVPSPPPVSSQAARDALGLPADGALVGMVARMERWKGAHVFVDAAVRIAHEMPSARFFMLGGVHPYDPGYADEVRALARESGLGQRLSLAGQRPAQEVALWHAAADVMVHPATEPEPFGMAVVEAMAAGRAVVASDAGGIREILRDGRDGLLVTPGDPCELAGTVLHLLRDDALRTRIASAAVRRAADFSVEIFTARFETLLASVLHPGEALHA